MNNKYDLHKEISMNACDQMLSILKKGEVFIKEKNLDEKNFLEARLIDDMYPFVKQVQVFSDNIKGSISRLAGTETPVYEDKEISFAELIQRVENTKKYVESISPDLFEGSDEKKIKLFWMPEGMYMTGKNYLEHYTLQNSFFHLVTAYNILRVNGVNLGKMDYMSGVNFLNENN